MLQAVTKRVQFPAHQGSISSLQWMQHSVARDLIVSASSDKRAAVWIPEPGMLVGDFGQQHQWTVDDPVTWRNSSPNAAAGTGEQHLQPSCVSSGQVCAEQQPAACSEWDMLSDNSAEYSSGDEMLPGCFMEKSEDDNG